MLEQPFKSTLIPTTHIVSGRTNRDILLGNIDADTQTLGVDIREVMLGLLRILMGYIQTDMIQSMNLHLLIDGTGHDVARSQTQSLIIFSMKLSPLGRRKMPPYPRIASVMRNAGWVSPG